MRSAFDLLTFVIACSARTRRRARPRLYVTLMGAGVNMSFGECT